MWWGRQYSHNNCSWHCWYYKKDQKFMAFRGQDVVLSKDWAKYGTDLMQRRTRDPRTLVYE